MSEKVVAIAARHIQTSWFNVVMSMKYACKEGVTAPSLLHTLNAIYGIECIWKDASDEKTRVVTEAFLDAFRRSLDRF
jgi:hypothetical protein